MRSRNRTDHTEMEGNLPLIFLRFNSSLLFIRNTIEISKSPLTRKINSYICKQHVENWLLTVFFFYIPQDEVNQIVTSNVRLRQV